MFTSINYTIADSWEHCFIVCLVSRTHLKTYSLSYDYVVSILHVNVLHTNRHISVLNLLESVIGARNQLKIVYITMHFSAAWRSRWSGSIVIVFWRQIQTIQCEKEERTTKKIGRIWWIESDIIVAHFELSVSECIFFHVFFYSSYFSFSFRFLCFHQFTSEFKLTSKL